MRTATLPFISAKIEDLVNLLGFKNGERYASDKLAPHLYLLSLDSVDNMYVYCDLLKHVVIGDTKAPLLRIVNKPVTLYGIVHKIFNPVMYVPLQKKKFDTVEINIMDDTGKSIPFRSGKTKSLVVLEFRRFIYPYFALYKNVYSRPTTTIICCVNVARVMKRKVYCCDASRHMYEDYYSRQAGGEIPVFAGSRYQRGHGLGSVWVVSFDDSWCRCLRRMVRHWL